MSVWQDYFAPNTVILLENKEIPVQQPQPEREQSRKKEKEKQQQKQQQ